MKEEIKLILYAENKIRLVQAKVKIYRWLKKFFRHLNLQGFIFENQEVKNERRI